MENTEIEPKTKMTLREAIVDLYLNVKIRSSEEINKYTEEKNREEKEKLKDTDPFVVLDYIKSSVEMIMSIKFDDSDVSKETPSAKAESLQHSSCISGAEPPLEYEEIIVRLEAEVRNHIRIEQQLKLHIESLQFKLEENEKKHKTLEEQVKNIEKEFVANKELVEKLKQDLTKMNKSKVILGRHIENNNKTRMGVSPIEGHGPPLEHKEGEVTPLTEEKRTKFFVTKSNQKLPIQQKDKRKSLDGTRGSKTQRNLGIQEQNIFASTLTATGKFQIICRSPDKDPQNPYLLELYRHRLEEKDQEIGRLKREMIQLRQEGRTQIDPLPLYEKSGYLGYTSDQPLNHARSKSNRPRNGEKTALKTFSKESSNKTYFTAGGAKGTRNTSHLGSQGENLRLILAKRSGAAAPEISRQHSSRKPRPTAIRQSSKRGVARHSEYQTTQGHF